MAHKNKLVFFCTTVALFILVTTYFLTKTDAAPANMTTGITHTQTASAMTVRADTRKERVPKKIASFHATSTRVVRPIRTDAQRTMTSAQRTEARQFSKPEVTYESKVFGNSKSKIEIKAKSAVEMKNEPQKDPVPVPAQKVQSRVSAKDVALLLSGQNKARANVGVSPLIWSDTLARGAQEWANTLAQKQCPLQHSGAPYGENLYSIWSANKNFTSSGSQAVTWWVNEKSDYNYSSNTCDKGKVCGHYTQIVWAHTTAVGCGVSRCETGSSAKDMWVCRYNPIGNIPGKKPY